MTRFGLTWEPPPQSVSALSYNYDRLFGLLDTAEAEAYGYHPARSGSLAADGSTIDEVKPARSVPLTADQEAVASGETELDQMNGHKVPVGGCIGESRARVGDVVPVLELTESAVAYATEQADRDPRVLQGFAEWSQCMTEAGFDYATPWDSNDDPQWATPHADELEIKVAVADVACKNKTDLTGLRVAVAAAWQREFIRAHSEEFVAMADSIAAQRKNASSILAEDG